VLEEREDACLLAEMLEQERVAKLRRDADQSLQRQRELDDAAKHRISPPNVYLGPPVRHIVIPKALVYGAVAAMIALAVVAFWPQPPSPDAPSAPQVRQYIEVATLIEQVDAQWEGASHALDVGTPVYDEPARLVK